MRQSITVSAALLLLAVALSAGAETPPESDRLVDYSVLTPGLAGKFLVFTAPDLTIIGVSRHANTEQTKALRQLVERERYEPCSRLGPQIMAALQAAGYSAAEEPIIRAAAGRPQSLARADLPENPRGMVLLDVTIEWLGLRADMTGQAYRPALALTWRLISRRGELVAPGRLLTYNGRAAYYSVGGVGLSLAPLPSRAPPPGQPNVDPGKSCEFDSFKAAEDDPRAIWNCLDAAFRGAGDQLAFELSKR